LADLVAEAFKVKSVPGLGKVFECKVCGALFVSANDAQRHITLYHRATTSLRLQQLLEGAVKVEKKEERCREERRRAMS
jgi:hypothetical protein